MEIYAPVYHLTVSSTYFSSASYFFFFLEINGAKGTTYFLFWINATVDFYILGSNFNLNTILAAPDILCSSVVLIIINSMETLKIYLLFFFAK